MAIAQSASINQKSATGLWRIFLLLVAGFWLGGCTDIENQRPVSDFEKGTGPLPEFNVRLDSTGSQTIRFDSIAQGGNFSLSFTPMSFGKIRIVEEGKAVQIQMPGRNWKKDSTEYTICKNQVCRKGKIVLTNAQYLPPDTVTPIDTACSELPIRYLYVAFNTAAEIKNLFPFGGHGKIDSLKTQIYSATNKGDSAIVFTTSGIFVEQSWAWDTIRYQLKASNRKCWTGKIAVVLGDTCEARARDDAFTIPTGNALWPETLLTANDKGCNGLLGNHLTRTDREFDYGNYKVMSTANGILTDTLVGGFQYYKYQRTNALATKDEFIYYFKNNTSNRVTMARVKITF